MSPWPKRLWIASGAAALLLLAGPEGASAQVLGIPCAPGSYSADGFQPCTICSAGTFNPFQGASSCQACIEGRWAAAGATFCAACECTDDALCTIDRCDATTGVCTAHEPAPSCQPYAVQLTAVVTTISGLAPLFTVGSPIVGSWIVDPSDLDMSQVDWAGTYPEAIVDLHVRVGEGPGAVEGHASRGWLYVEPVPLRASDYLDLVASPLVVPGFANGVFSLTLDDGDDPAIVSDAIPLTFPDPASFAVRELVFSVSDGVVGATAMSDDFSLTVPEPRTGLAGAVAAGAIFFLRRCRRGSAIPLLKKPTPDRIESRWRAKLAVVRAD